MKKQLYEADEEVNESFWQEYGQMITACILVFLFLGFIFASLYFTFNLQASAHP